MRPAIHPTDTPQDSKLIALADRCVACGLCVPLCPTWRATLSEADSPRGRIALMRGALEGRIPFTGRLVEHIDGCLSCRACEAACPNNVPYGELVEAFRTPLAKARPDGLAARTLRRWLLGAWIARPARIAALAPLLQVYLGSGLQRWLRRGRLSGALARLEAQLPERRVRAPMPVTARPAREARGRVALFFGCAARLVDGETLAAAAFVLNRLGYEVVVPADQTCCGAIHRHAGDPSGAEALEASNRSAFAGSDAEAVLVTASGCGAQLRLHPLAGAPPVMDICEFLDRAGGWDGVRVEALGERVAVHEPCSLRNGLRASAAVYRVLARIPGARVEPLPGNDRCCGAAGLHFLTQPGMAEALLADKITAWPDGVGLVASANWGCARHLARGSRDAGGNAEVMHPVTILAQQMGYRSGRGT